MSRSRALKQRGFGTHAQPSRSRTAEEGFRLLAANVVDYAIVMLDPQGTVVGWNLGAERLKGYRAAEIIGRHFSLFYSDEDVRAGKPMQELKVASRVGRFEDTGWRIRKDGSRFWANVVITALRDPSGMLLGFGKIIQDLTERMRAKAAIRESEEKLRLLIESIKDCAIFMLDTRGVVQSWNSGAERIKGYRPNEIIGQHFSKFYSEEDIAAGKPLRELEVAAREGRFEDEGLRVRKDGSRFWANVVISAIRDDEGNLMGFSKLTRDLTEVRQVRALEEFQRATFNILEDYASEKARIEDTQKATFNVFADFADERQRLEGVQRATFNILEDFAGERERLENLQLAAFNILEDLQLEKKRLSTEVRERERAEAELEGANKELEAFSYSVSHDLRAPLRAVDGFSQALLEDYSDSLDDNGKQYLKYVREASQQMAQLIDDLLNLSRMTRSEMTRGEVNLSALVLSTVEALRRTSPERKAEITVTPGMIVNGDVRLLRIVIENLLGNAWKFTSKRSIARIEFGAKSVESGMKAYFIRDNGAGFDMGYANKLFGAFQRLHGGTEFPGTGIGLATVRRIIHRHGGKVWAEGKVDVGATFYFTLG